MSEVLTEIEKSILLSFSEIKTIVNNENMTDTEKVSLLKTRLEDNEKEKKNIKEKISLLKRKSESITNDNHYYNILETMSIKLQNRVSEIIKHLNFDENNSDSNLIKAIIYYKSKDGSVDKKSPMDFLKEKERNLLFDEEGKFRVSLYKILLFRDVMLGIKSGAINFSHSYKYKSLNDYLISKELWEKIKDELIERAGLSKFRDFDKVLKLLIEELNNAYVRTNKNILNGKNTFAKFDKKGRCFVHTPKLEKDEMIGLISELMPQNRYINLFEILSTSNAHTDFLKSFEHYSIKHKKFKPKDKSFFASIIGLGCNFGSAKMKKISKNIDRSEIDNVVNWYLNVESIQSANDKIISFIEQLPVNDILKKEELITSSDGYVIEQNVDSLNADYSAKYFNRYRKGSVVYTFIDYLCKLFYGTVISTSEKESMYVIDGLMHNDVVKSDIHTTDTGGFSEGVFGITHLLDFSFAPRIKNMKKQTLYGFKDYSKKYKESNYKISPDKYINTQLIKDNWNDILRFVASIKLKISTASQLFKRLNSYSRSHPLYKAIKEFGRIFKTIFILKYIDDLPFRQIIEKQLNLGELSNKFSRAVMVGGNQEFNVGLKEEQNMVEGCKRLIQNSLILWNSLYLSYKLCNAETEEDKESMTKIIQNSSLMTWSHTNFTGEYDFSDEQLKNNIYFDMNKIHSLKT